MAQGSADGSAGGRGFLRDMAARSARAHAFDRWAAAPVVPVIPGTATGQGPRQRG